MGALDTLFMSLRAILANKLRSALTLVGIVAGVASIIRLPLKMVNCPAMRHSST